MAGTSIRFKLWKVFDNNGVELSPVGCSKRLLPTLHFTGWRVLDQTWVRSLFDAIIDNEWSKVVLTIKMIYKTHFNLFLNPVTILTYSIFRPFNEHYRENGWYSKISQVEKPEWFRRSHRYSHSYIQRSRNQSDSGTATDAYTAEYHDLENQSPLNTAADAQESNVSDGYNYLTDFLGAAAIQTVIMVIYPLTSMLPNPSNPSDPEHWQHFHYCAHFSLLSIVSMQVMQIYALAYGKMTRHTVKRDDVIHSYLVVVLQALLLLVAGLTDFVQHSYFHR